MENLREVLNEFFDEEELRTLCFDLKTDYDSLPAQGKSGKAREIVALFQRESRIPELIAACYKMRPNVYWRHAKHENAVPPATNTRATNRMLMLQVGRLEIKMQHVESVIAGIQSAMGDMRSTVSTLKAIAVATLAGMIILLIALGLTVLVINLP